MKFILLNIVVFLFVSLLSINVSNTVKPKRRKYCHFNEAFKCGDNLRYFSARDNGTGITITEHEFDYSCSELNVALKRCIRNWFKRCGNALHNEIYESLVMKPASESIDQLCDRNGQQRKIFLEQSPCLHWKVKQLPEYRSICVKDLQAGLEWIQTKFTSFNGYNNKHQFHSVCCIYNRWEKCITDYLIEKCGPQQDQSIRILIGSATTYVLEEFCRFDLFNPSTDLCKQYFQPNKMIPKGLLSDSFPSWVFSYQCPNIGYGILLDKDITDETFFNHQF